MKSSTTRALMAKKQSTSFTQVATNLLNLLQGYTKGIRFVAVLTILLTMGIGQAWGETVTFTFNTEAGIQELGLTAPASSNGTDLTENQAYTKSNVSLSATHGSTNTRVWNSSGSYDLRVYTGGSLTFSVPTGSNITKIVSTGTAANFSVNTGTFQSGTWTGKANSVTYTASATLKMKTFTVTYEAAVTTYTITLNTNGGTINAGNVTSYTYGVGATLPTNVTKENHQFGGWFDNSGCTGTAVTAISTTATGNKEYWAKWTELPKYIVTWSVDGNTTTEEVYSGKKPTGAPTIDPNDLPCEGADKFVGWTTDSYSGDTPPTTLYPTANDIPTITDNITFYAVFADYAD